MRTLMVVAMLMVAGGAVAHDIGDHHPALQRLGEGCEVVAECGEELSRVVCGDKMTDRWLYVSKETGKVKAACPRNGCEGQFKRSFCVKTCEPLAKSCTP